MTESRSTRIESLLYTAFAPAELLVEDQSHLHVGHAGAKDGRGHFEVTIVADAFAQRSRLECHRLIYEALEPMMTSDIHALSIRASGKKTDLSE